MKKIISTLAASLMAVSTLTAVSAPALNVKTDNTFAITTESLKTAITADDGTVIPAGATSVTVSISGNTGFTSKSVKLDVGSADVIVDESGLPVVDSGAVIGDSVIGSAENNGTVVLVSASAEENTSDGDIFTFYVSDSSADVSVIEIDPQVKTENLATPFAIRYSYLIGDVNGDKYVNAVDATSILSAIATYKNEKHSDAIPLNEVKNNLKKYFPYNTPQFAETADCNEDTLVTPYDAECVSNYYAAAATSGVFDFDKVAYAGEVRYIYQ